MTEPPQRLAPLHITLHRSPRSALRAKSVRAGTVHVPLTWAMIEALSPEERAIFDAVIDHSEGTQRCFESERSRTATMFVRFSMLVGGVAHVEFDADEVTDETIGAALRATLQREIAHREALAAAIRDDMRHHVKVLGTGLTGPAETLAMRPGPRHPMLDEMLALRREQQEREAAEHEATENKRKAALRAEYLALPDEALIRRSHPTVTPWRWEPVRAPGGVERRDDDVIDVERRAERLAHEANALLDAELAPHREALRDYVQLNPELAQRFAADADGNILPLHIASHMMRNLGDVAKGASSRARPSSPHTGEAASSALPCLNPRDEDASAFDAVKRRVTLAANSLPHGVTCAVSSLRGPVSAPYVIISIASPIFGHHYISVTFSSR